MAEARRIPILDVPTDAQTFANAIRTLTAWAREDAGRRYVSTCPVYTLMLCREQPRALAALQGAAMVAADGMPIVWLQRRRGAPEAERVYGPDVLEALCETDVRHFFWGGSPEVSAKLVAALRARHPQMQIAGAYAPPMMPVGEAPDQRAIARLNASNAQVVWVGLGSPKQDVWMRLHRPHLRAPLLIGVGAAFDLFAGTRRQAPRWMQRTGLEWLFRLLQEPRRLARRYLVYNPRFIAAVLREGIGRRG